MEAEKQLIQALVLNQNASEAIEPLRGQAFWQGVWSWPALTRLLDSAGNVEKALSDLEDEELAGEVRAAVMESPGALTIEQVMESINKLYDAHLVKREREIREQLNSYKSEGAPRELLAERQAIMLERNRIGRGIAPNP
jgi:DNA-binding transcriptional ArsR family regulator